jgi:Holliday junction resolvase
MSGNHSRRKGASAERELAGLVHEQLGCRLVRRLEQTRSGGFDLAPAPGQSGAVVERLAGLALEVKRASRATPAMLREWWQQTHQQAAAAGLVPALAYRQDRAGWRVLLPLAELNSDMPAPLPDSPELCVELSLAGFAAVIREAV